MEIILLRHGKPNIPSLNKIKAFAFKDWIDSYNAAGLNQQSIPTEKALIIANKCKVVVCSELPRSKESAAALKIKKITLSHSQFNEAGLPSANWNSLKLSPAIWAIIFRILWLFGYSNNSESYKEANTRAKKSAQKLIALAQEHERVLFIGHGIYNKLLSKQLRLLGWSGPANPGTKHWSFGTYKND